MNKRFHMLCNFKIQRRLRSVLPGFSVTMGFTLTYLSLIVLIPLSALLFKTFSLGWD